MNPPLQTQSIRTSSTQTSSTRTASLRILIADDHELIRRGVRSLLQERAAWSILEAADGAEALHLAATTHPDVAILDLSMPNLDGHAVLEQIPAVSPQTRVIVLSMWDTEDVFLRVMKAGARAYLLKSSADVDLVSAVEAVHNGRFFFTMSIADKIVSSFLAQSVWTEPRSSKNILTDRETEVLALLAQGLTNKEVATRLQISQRTAETHRNNINRKLTFTSTAQLVRYAIAHGIADDVAGHHQAAMLGSRPA